MPRGTRRTAPAQKKITQYEHTGAERTNNPPVGLVTPDTDKDGAKKKYAYDPHLDPSLQWAGKAERLSFEVPTVSLHVHERIDPKRIIEAVRKPHTNGQESLFEQNERPLREEIEFYKHRDGWSNRLIAGNSLFVMNSLLEKEGMAGKVQMVYFDPPYGIKYQSNFQPFVNKRDVKDGKDEDLTAEPEMIQAFRDTWELEIHSYLSSLRDQLLLARDLLSEEGSLFLQISDAHSHTVKCVLDEVFGVSNKVATIAWKKGAPNSSTIRNAFNYLLWYSKDKKKVKTFKLYSKRRGDEGTTEDPKKLPLWGDFRDGTSRPLSTEEKRNILETRKQARVFRVDKIIVKGDDPERRFPIEINGAKCELHEGFVWRGDQEQILRLASSNRIVKTKTGFGFKFYLDDNPVVEITNFWDDTAGNIADMVYVVQTNEKLVERCVLLTTDPGELVLDITCGSGTTAAVSERNGRRWVTCDTSRVALTLAKQRLLTSRFDYYLLAHPNEGVSSGFKYNKAIHIDRDSIANLEPPKEISLLDDAERDLSRTRITGPFTVEAVPAPMVRGMEDFEMDGQNASDASIARSGETLRQSEWREELLCTGVRGKGGAKIEFTRIEPMLALRDIQAEGETKDGKKVYIVFGPEFAPLEQRQVERAWQEAKPYKPDMLLFCAFQFDDEAAKDIDEMKPELTGMQMLKVQMNADLLTDDLLKKRRSNESFWLIGQPDIGWTEDKQGMITVEVRGWDYYNPKTGNVESGKKTEIAMWLLDTDYDERSLFPTQVFLPMAGDKEGWSKLAKNLRAEIDEEKIEAYRGTVSLPFEKPKSGKFAVKIIDDRGIESLRVVKL